MIVRIGRPQEISSSLDTRPSAWIEDLATEIGLRLIGKNKVKN